MKSMLYEQSYLSEYLIGKKAMWMVYEKTQEDIKYKNIDINIQKEELQTTYTKGEETSYGRAKTNDSLINKYGVFTKRQNGSVIQSDDISTIENAVSSFFDTVINLKKEFLHKNLLVSYSKNTHMHGSNATGLWYPSFNAIGVSDIGNLQSTLAHEIGHFIDNYLGDIKKRHYMSDDNSSTAGKIAHTFRKNMRAKQKSKYLNRTTECFARAIEQYYCIKNNINSLDNSNYYCDNSIFTNQISPMIEKLLIEVKAIPNAMFSVNEKQAA